MRDPGYEAQPSAFPAARCATPRSPLTHKLSAFAPLTEDDRAALDALATVTRIIAPQRDLLHEGETAEAVHVVLQGFACRSKLLANGKRQILAFLVPGDLSDPHPLDAIPSDHTLTALTSCTVATIPRTDLIALIEAHSRVAQALRLSARAEQAGLHERLLSLGQRPADQRMAHLLCELLVRLQAAGEAEGDRCVLPLTQADFADALGLTPVHVNRTLQGLRAAGLIVLRNRQLDVPDLARLRALAGFQANYLRCGVGSSRLESIPQAGVHMRK